MARERFGMRLVREILRLKQGLGRSHREVARSLGISVGAVASVVDRCRLAGVVWEDVETLSDAEVERLVYGPIGPVQRRPGPDCLWIHTELTRPGVTLQLLHLEYLEQQPEGYRYTQFCDIYRRWRKKRRRSMRQIHRAGEKMFVDYAGQKPHIVEPSSGECIEVELFVAVLCGSNLTYAEATHTQQAPDWIASHVRAFEFFDGVAGAVVPDQLKSGVSKSCRYEPVLQRTYEDLARHYGTVILPARPASPRDKAKVETAVQIVERWILARIRNETFFSLNALNARIRELLVELNGRPMRDYGKSRLELFEMIEKQHLKPLPAERFVFATWKKARVNIDYHVPVDKHYYSVPHRLVHEQVELRVSANTVEVYHRNMRLASHRRSLKPGFTTLPEHMPKSHRAHLEWSPSRFIRWAGKIGPHTQALVQAILSERPHPEQGYRSCLGILRLAKTYGNQRLEAACRRAVAVRARSYKHVQAILKNGLDQAPPLETPAPHRPILHANVRGPEYYR